MSATDRLRKERDFHDQQAAARATTFRRQPERLWVDDSTYLRHESWIEYGFRRLGELHGTRVLDFGCGHAMASVVLTRCGAEVTAFDLSHGYLSEARARAKANGVRIDLVQANGERLPFADNMFDRVWGNAVLHHLDIDVAGAEIFRVLRPGGIAVFCEPWGGNRLLNWARRQAPYQGKHRTPDEAPLGRCQLQSLRKIFPRLECKGFQLLGMARRLWQREKVRMWLDRWDEVLLSRVRALERFCRYVVLTLHR